MKKIICLLLLAIPLIGFAQDENKCEYDIKVTDMEYESFLAGQQNITFFEEESLKTKNRNYVATWNKRHYSTDDFSDNMYVEPIDYDPTYEYGKEFEYKLYMFFKFIEKKYNIKFS